MNKFKLSIIIIGTAAITFAALDLAFKVESTVDETDKALTDFYSCIELKHKENLCQQENERAYQLLNKLDVQDKLGEELQEQSDFKRVAGSCWATYECETYSCLNKNLWRCKP